MVRQANWVSLIRCEGRNWKPKWWCLKAVIPGFPLSPYFGADILTVTRSLVVDRQTGRVTPSICLTRSACGTARTVRRTAKVSTGISTNEGIPASTISPRKHNSRCELFQTPNGMDKSNCIICTTSSHSTARISRYNKPGTGPVPAASYPRNAWIPQRNFPSIDKGVPFS